MTAHHRDFSYMLWKMEKDNYSYNFQISNTRGYGTNRYGYGLNISFSNLEKKYGKYPESFAIREAFLMIGASPFILLNKLSN